MAAERREPTDWKIWLDIETELEVREPFTPMRLLSRNPECVALFSPLPHAVIPDNLPPPLLQQVFNQILGNVQVLHVPLTPFLVINGVVESHRLASRFISEGRILAIRRPDLQIAVNVITEIFGWQSVETRNTEEEVRHAG